MQGIEVRPSTDKAFLCATELRTLASSLWVTRDERDNPLLSCRKPNGGGGGVNPSQT